MNVNFSNSQAFTGRYLYDFRNEAQKSRIYKQMGDGLVRHSDRIVLEDPHLDRLLLLTGQDYIDYCIMSDCNPRRNPIVDRSQYQEKLYYTFANNADIVDMIDVQDVY